MMEFDNNVNDNTENTGNTGYGSGAADTGRASGSSPMDSYEFGQTVYGSNAQPSPEKPKKKKNGAGRVVKKILGITLAAVLFGSVAAGSFQTVNYLTGKVGFKNSAQLAAESKAALLKTTAVADSNATITGSMDVSDIAEAVMPSIVSISNKSVEEVRSYFGFFGFEVQPRQRETESWGSGIIIGKNDRELLIVTNYHVVENANVLSACFIDGQVYEAKIKGTDPENDLAVIAIALDSISEESMTQIAVAAMGDSDNLKVGKQVVAIGNALGYGQSVTTGIVSATNRSIGKSTPVDGSKDDDMQKYIQTDAAINPGNSGGALVNMNGEVIGINTAKVSGSAVEGMGYAIPISKVSDIIENLMNEVTRSKVADSERSSIGISGTTVTEELHAMLGIPKGVHVTEIIGGGAAEAAGIMTGDVIVKFDGKTIMTIEQLKEVLQYYAAGETVDVIVMTPGSGVYTERTVPVTLGTAADVEK